MDFSRNVGRAVLAQACIAWATMAGCASTSEPCGTNQHYDEDSDRCLCDANTVADGAGDCVACGANETVVNGECQCMTDFVRGESGACESLPALGRACDTEACTDNVFDTCVESEAGDYCTSTGCESTADCQGGYACFTATSSGGASYCQRPPVGMGQGCESDADCAGTEATYCDTRETEGCLVEGCTIDPGNCFEGYTCCDFSPFGLNKTLCIPSGNLPPIPCSP